MEIRRSKRKGVYEDASVRNSLPRHRTGSNLTSMHDDTQVRFIPRRDHNKLPRIVHCPANYNLHAGIHVRAHDAVECLRMRGCADPYSRTAHPPLYAAIYHTGRARFASLCEPAATRMHITEYVYNIDAYSGQSPLCVSVCVCVLCVCLYAVVL